MKIETKYGIGDRVRIIDLERQHATVQSIHVGVKGVTYEVAWFHCGERKSAYLFAEEMESHG